MDISNLLSELLALAGQPTDISITRVVYSFSLTKPLPPPLPGRGAGTVRAQTVQE